MRGMHNGGVVLAKVAVVTVAMIASVLTGATTPSGAAVRPPALFGHALPAVDGSGPMFLPRRYAGTSGPKATFLGGDAAQVTIGGQPWDLIVEGLSLQGETEVGVELDHVTNGATTAEEAHAWDFLPTTKATLSFDAKSGRGKLDSGQSASPVATVDVTFTATGKQRVACTTGSETNYTGTLSGEVVVDTGLGAAGTVGGKALTFTASGSQPEISVDDNCISSGPPPSNPCVSAIEAQSGETGVVAGALTGIEAKTHQTVGLVSVSEQTALTSPQGAVRADGAEIVPASVTWDAGTRVVSLSAGTSGVVTGQATVSGGKAQTDSQPCRYHHTSYTLTLTEASKATYRSPKGHALTAHTQLSGNLVAPNSKQAEYEIQTAQKG